MGARKAPTEVFKRLVWLWVLLVSFKFETNLRLLAGHSACLKAIQRLFACVFSLCLVFSPGKKPSCSRILAIKPPQIKQTDLFANVYSVKRNMCFNREKSTQFAEPLLLLVPSNSRLNPSQTFQPVLKTLTKSSRHVQKISSAGFKFTGSKAPEGFQPRRWLKGGGSAVAAAGNRSFLWFLFGL